MRTLTQSFKPAFSLSSFTFIKRLFFSPLHFLPLGWCHLYIWSYWYFSQQSWFQLVIKKTKIIGSGPITFANRLRKTGNSDRLHFLGLQNPGGGWLQPWNYETLAYWKKSYEKARQHIKEQRHHFADKSWYSLSYGFSSNHVWMWELDHKEGWAPKNWCFQTVVLEKTLENPDCKIKPVNLTGNQSWMFIGRIDAEAPKLWPPFGHAKSWLIGKDPDAGKYWRQEEKGTIRGWDGRMVSPTQWTWVWANSGRWRRTGKSGMLLSMRSQSWTWLPTEQQQHNLKAPCSSQLLSQ